MNLMSVELRKRAKKSGGRLVVNATQVRFLDSLGYSDYEIGLYDLLLFNGVSMTAQDVAGHAPLFPSAVYRLFYDLEAGGLIRQVKVRPKSYYALQPDQAFSRALEIHRQKLQSQLEKIYNTPQEDSLPAEVILGRQGLYQRYVAEVEKACGQIRNYSIGIAYSDEMYKAHQRADKRGVKVRYVFQQYKPANFPILRKWKNVGMELRHSKAERGFHLMIFDDQRVIVSFSDPANTEDRLSIVTDNNTALQIFGSYFESLWLLAKPVELDYIA